MQEKRRHAAALPKWLREREIKKAAEKLPLSEKVHTLTRKIEYQI